MSDFLRNLRSSHKKDISDRKKNLDGHYYPQHDRRSIQDRRSNQSESLDSLLAGLSQTLPEILDSSSSLIHSLERLMSKNELLIETRIRHYNAMSIFFNNLNKIFSEELFVPPSGKSAKATASYTSGTHYTKDDILTLIRSMRKKGATFAVIADYLTEKGIPTFSGRGEWHAQTIHRLCK